MKLLIGLLACWAAAQAADAWRDEGVIYLDHTPNVARHPVPVRAVTLDSGLWAERRKTNVERSVPTMLKHNGVVYEKPLASEPLYDPLAQARTRAVKPAKLTFIPYYAWANREPGAMEVWVPLP